MDRPGTPNEPNHETSVDPQVDPPDRDKSTALSRKDEHLKLLLETKRVETGETPREKQATAGCSCEWLRQLADQNAE